MALFTGRLKEPLIDYLTGKLTILFEPCEDFRQTYEELKGCEKLSLEIKKYRRKRSLDANAYYWALCAKLAKVVGASNPEIHNKMLRLYGQPYLVDGYALYTPVPNTEEAIRQVDNSEEYHLIATTEVRSGKGGVDYRTYKMLRGSHTYNTEEMSRLIDGLIAECRNAGIPDAEIASPEEKRLLKERYGVDLG